jgi:oligoribonuclease
MERMLWIDMEMTGLDVEKEVIIEVAAIVTDLKLEKIDTYHSVVKQPQEYLDRMDDWNRTHHGKSGLTDLVPSGKEPQIVEADLLNLVEKNFRGDRAVLAGNSIYQDRMFINKYFPKLNEKLHYRMLDVTSFKLIFNYLYQISYTKKASQHRAIADIEESISELKKYLSYIDL